MYCDNCNKWCEYEIEERNLCSDCTAYQERAYWLVCDDCEDTLKHKTGCPLCGEGADDDCSECGWPIGRSSQDHCDGCNRPVDLAAERAAETRNIRGAQ
jgi:hypothetical protein